MQAATGFGAGCLVHCEMYGLSCFEALLITDSHTVTVEAMQAYKSIFSRYGLPDDVEEIFTRPSFRPVL